MDPLSEAVIAGAPAEELAALNTPASYVAAHLRAEDTEMFTDVADKDVRKSLRVGEVPMPELAPDEVLVAVMASAINYNTVWSAMFEPIPTFQFLKRFARAGGWTARHDLPYQVIGSDAAGVIVRVGSGVRRWKIGDHVVVNPAYVDEQESASHDDAMLGAEQLAWGFETNFGGLAHYSVVRASQLVPKPAQLSWEEAASNPLCMGTAYRMLVGEHGARMKQGNVVLIWGAAGGLGTYAIQFVRNGGGIPVGVVSSDAKAEAIRKLGCEVVVDRREIGLDNTIADDPARVLEVGKRLGRIIRREVGEDPHIVFEHTGRATFGVSLFVVRRGGAIVTCGSSSGYRHEYDNRYLWMKLKRVIGSHAANLHEQWEANKLVTQGRISSALSHLYPLTEVGEAARKVQVNEHIGKVGVLCLAPEPGLGITDSEARARAGTAAPAPLALTAASVA
ncbi:crotonyl-CoA carboxylase/reductase [Actinoalloteichus hymeniacidonis]|uniref:Crotonyl-CoA carboxylase/reductase n=1 Tax=Actinoalloteichus hymeniacidonis TaxID=340345 RepID=A0AAC9HSM3_9PSEU|nr:crotonyl-CoA carboxylase/reductase [Actinoalloteichus hymeniacidonis]AOS63740.1 crotonyl-CoA carboxylase/reductase [Actinoalloteichus hymeniacidonis]MBB5908206.1 crotonyl-CoA reductase [Actinoalloteichus hymeniacidonis]